MEEFVGFTFNGIHSSSLGILRIYKEGLEDWPFLPAQKDLVDTGVNKDETYYYGEKSDSLVFIIRFFYGPINETGFQSLTEFCKSKGVGELVFDEYQHKKYYVKLTDSVVSHHNVYNGSEENRQYIGEGSFTFTCFSPYSYGRFLYAEEVGFEIPTWEKGKIINIKHSAAPSCLYIKQDELNELEQILGKFDEKDAIIGEQSVQFKVPSKSIFCKINKTSFDEMVVGNLPSRLSCEEVWLPDGRYFRIDNVGDCDIPFQAIIAEEKGEINLAMDGEIKMTLLKTDNHEVLYDGKLGAFVNPDTKKLDTSCRVISGDFFNIPTGIHLLSIVQDKQHIWDSQKIKELKYCYRYY